MTSPNAPSRIAAADPVRLTIPGLHCSGPDHWQTLWERMDRRYRRVELPGWDDPDPAAWIDTVGDAIGAAGAPVLLVAHSLGCHAVAGWARSAGAGTADIVGALLVAPPDVDRIGTDPAVARFAPTAPGPLPFPALLVASRTDPYATFARSTEMAAEWGAGLVDAGASGHINAESGLGDWRAGQHLVARLLGACS